MSTCIPAFQMFIDKLWTQFGQSTNAGPQYSAIWMGAWWSGLIPKPHHCFELPEGLERDLGAQLIIWLLVSHQQPHSALWCCLQRPDAAGWWSRLGREKLFVVWQVAENRECPFIWFLPPVAYFLSKKPGNNHNFTQRNWLVLLLWNKRALRWI